jgi:hypothetical protein
MTSSSRKPHSLNATTSTPERSCTGKKARKLPPPDTRTPSGRDLWGNKTIEAHERSLVGNTAEAVA